MWILDHWQLHDWRDQLVENVNALKGRAVLIMAAMRARVRGRRVERECGCRDNY